jgi:hypothetical protein
MEHLEVAARRAGASRPPVLLRLVKSQEANGWDELMVAHHHLGFRSLVGGSLMYVA